MNILQPMLCTEVSDTSQIKLPCWVSEKLNGIRAIWNPVERRFQTRKGKFWHDWMTNKIWQDNAPPSVAIDGEFYLHGLAPGQIASRAGVKILSDPGLPIEYHVYDVHSNGVTVEHRMELVKRTCVSYPSNVRILDQTYCDTIQQVNNIAIDLGLKNSEGLVARAAGYTYAAGCRSPYMQKLKFMSDDDVEVINFKEGTGKFRSTLGAMQVRDGEGRIFDIGGGCMTNADRHEVWQNQGKYLGQTATIRFPYRSEDMVPLQAVFICWRNYE